MRFYILSALLFIFWKEIRKEERVLHRRRELCELRHLSLRQKPVLLSREETEEEEAEAAEVEEEVFVFVETESRVSFLGCLDSVLRCTYSTGRGPTNATREFFCIGCLPPVRLSEGEDYFFLNILFSLLCERETPITSLSASASTFSSSLLH